VQPPWVLTKGETQSKPPKGLRAGTAGTNREKSHASNRGQAIARHFGHWSGHTFGPNTRAFQVGPPGRVKSRICWLSGVRRAKFLSAGLGQNRKVGPDLYR